jgi:hypothetical protein
MVYKNGDEKFQPMAVTDIVDKSMDKLHKQLENFYNDLKNQKNEYMIDENLLDNVKNVTDKKYEEFKTNFEGKYSKVLQKKQMPKKIYVRKMPGFKVLMMKNLGDKNNKITIKVSGINNIYTLNPIRIYLDSILHIFGNDEKYLPTQLVKQLCDITTPTAKPSSISISIKKPGVVIAPQVVLPQEAPQEAQETSTRQSQSQP